MKQSPAAGLCAPISSLSSIGWTDRISNYLKGDPQDHLSFIFLQILFATS